MAFVRFSGSEERRRCTGSLRDKYHQSGDNSPATGLTANSLRYGL